MTQRLAATLAPRGITLIDAPLSRTPKDAWEGTLDVMVGGDAAAVARARPVIDCFAGRVVPTGPVGTGHTMKLLNNFLSMGYAALYAEALMIGAKAGLKPAVFDAVVSGGRMDCGFYQTFRRYVIERDPEAHRFTLDNALKDVTYLAGFAQALGAANPVGAAVRNSFAPGGRRGPRPGLCADPVGPRGRGQRDVADRGVSAAFRRRGSPRSRRRASSCRRP